MEMEVGSIMAKKVIVTATENMDKKVLARTPGTLPDVTLTPLTVLERLLIKFLKVYFTALVAFTGAGALSIIPGVTPDAQAFDNFLQTLLLSAKMSLIPAIGTVLVNVSIFLTKLDEKMPELMA